MDQLDPNGIQQVVQLLNDTRVPDTEVQRRVTAQLEELNRHPDFNKYLTYIFVTASQDDLLRTTAGLALKNNINLHYHTSMNPEVQQYIKSGLIQILGSPQQAIRRTVANNITTIAGGDRHSEMRGLDKWPELIPLLLQALSSQDPNLVAGAFEALELLCDDLPFVLDMEIQGSRPTNTLIPRLIEIMKTAENEAVQSHCLSCLNHFLFTMPAILHAEMPAFLESVFKLATSPNSTVRRHVCHAFVQLVELRPDHMFFNSTTINNVIEYILHATNDGDEDVSLEACEFWTAICRMNEMDAARQLLTPHLARVVPLLLSKMTYSSHELELLDIVNSDADVADKETDLRPQHPKNRHMGGNEDSDDEDEDDANPVGWNIRKCSAAGLDNVASLFGDALWPHLQPVLQNNFNSPDWLQREAAVLALGAVAEGCLEAITPHLSQLLEYLCTLLKDPQPLIRSITCWTISRFSSWLVVQPEEDRYLRPIINELLQRIVDSNKRVQQVACSAFATLEDEAQDSLIPFLDPIVTTLMQAFGQYQARNMLILYDALGTLADAVGDALSEDKYLNAIVPLIMQRWKSLDMTNKQLLPLLECLTDLVQAFGPKFEAFATETYGLSIRIVQECVMTHKQALAANARLPELDPVIWALDLASAVIVAMQNKAEALLATTTPLMPLVFECLQPNAGLEITRQSALALIGDLAKTCISQINPHITTLMPTLASNLNPYHVSVCNNASWAIGEICVRIQQEQFMPFATDIVAKLVEVILNKHNDFNPHLLENCAITLGRIGMVVPDTLAPIVQNFLPHWCAQIRAIRDPTEKTHAYQGLIQVISRNPNASVPHLGHICDCIAHCNVHSPELHDNFHRLLHEFKKLVGEQQWASFLAQFPEKEKGVLVSRYHL